MNDHEVDPRLHAYLDAYLDGDPSASEVQAFEGDLRPGSTLRNQLDSLLQLRAWFRATQPRAPSNLYRSVVSALERELATRERVPARTTPPRPSRWSFPNRARLAWIGIPAAAAVFALVLVMDSERRPGGDVPAPGTVSLPPSSSPVAADQNPSLAPPPAIRTSRSVTSGGESQNTVRYVFTVQADRAREICLAGDFNYWKVCDTPLMRVGEDVWSIAIDLPRGRHEYMFVVDGRWVTDPTAMGYVEDGFGNRNALLVI